MIRLFFFATLLCFSPLLADEVHVLGLGAPCLDYILEIEEEELAQYKVKKGEWREVEIPLDVQIKASYVSSGSCVANTIKGLAHLGIPCALTGNIGNDGLGDKIQNIFQEAGVRTYFTHTSTPTSQVVALVTPDGDRSFCSFVKAEHEISEKDLHLDLFKGVRLVHLAGYRLPNGMYSEKALALAKGAGAIVSFDLANAYLAEKFRERLWGLLPAYVDILFANEQEAYALTHLPPKEAARFLKNFCKVAVVKIGDQGCWVCSQKNLFHSPGIPAKAVIDTTGAGDLFATAFLYGYLNHEPLERCAYLANLAGSAAVERFGAELSAAKWGEILQIFENGLHSN